MTLAQLDHKSAAMEAVRKAWEDALLIRVRAKVADAHAHAAKALTDVLKDTDDGRPSLLRLNRSPSFLAALARLDELWGWLAGTSEVSLKGKVRDARDAFLCRGAGLWLPLVPIEYRSRDGAEPTQEQRRLVRAAAIHGYDPRKVLEGPVRTAQRSLKAALEIAGRRSTPGHAADDALAAWESRTARALSATVTTLLSDSLEYCDRMAGRDLVKPELIDDTPVIVPGA